MIVLFLPIPNLQAVPETQCPDTLAKWQVLVEEIAEDIAPYGAQYAKKLIRSPAINEKMAFLERCEKQWVERRGSGELKAIHACTDRIRRFLFRAKNFSASAEGGVEGPARSLGFDVPDSEYYAKVDKYVALPAELQDQAFLQAISHPKKNNDISSATQYIEQLNEKLRKEGKEEILSFYFPTKLGNREEWQRGDAWRLFVRWPGNPVRFIQFATHEKHGGSGQTSVVSVHTDSEGTLHTYMKDHWREIPSEGPVTLPHVTEGVFKGNACITCHQSGPRALDPSSWSVLSEQTKEKVRKVNDEFSSMTGMRWGGFYDPESTDLGPPLGEPGPGQKRDTEFFEACTKEGFERERKQPRTGIEFEKLWKNRETVYAKLKSSMNCTSCHDGNTKGPIRVPFARTHTFMMISSGKMPPGNTLSEFERSLLSECLDKEMFGYWSKNGKVPGSIVRYLTENRCSSELPKTEGTTPDLSSGEKAHQ